MSTDLGQDKDKQLPTTSDMERERVREAEATVCSNNGTAATGQSSPKHSEQEGQLSSQASTVATSTQDVGGVGATEGTNEGIVRPVDAANPTNEELRAVFSRIFSEERRQALDALPNSPATPEGRQLFRQFVADFKVASRFVAAQLHRCNEAFERLGLPRRHDPLLDYYYPNYYHPDESTLTE